MGHPIRNADIHTFERNNDDGNGRKWIAQFYPYKIYPVFFSGKTEQEVVSTAEKMRTEAIEKYEAQWIARQQAKEKAAKTRKAKEGK